MEKEALFMPLKFKIDVLEALKEKNISTYSLRKEKLLSESTIQKLRDNRGVSWDSLEVICKLLGCQPADLIEYVDEPEAE